MVDGLTGKVIERGNVSSSKKPKTHNVMMTMIMTGMLMGADMTGHTSIGSSLLADDNVAAPSNSSGLIAHPTLLLQVFVVDHACLVDHAC